MSSIVNGQFAALANLSLPVHSPFTSDKIQVKNEWQIVNSLRLSICKSIQNSPFNCEVKSTFEILNNKVKLTLDTIFDIK
ncbi:hypothetical protein CHRY9390_00341 [Chryseobacterium aquaeductus]|uniref:Uncharacterized protein n=1 Tax=Chryseobacterium aquaeductus TaxID=2675056 RepID=A0A9N8MDX0_9FLAO|nr:hypothetical protein CHRY9390_00341 [Chryseobacterium potabilaquae]CAD7798470.1 hypothetical protein CHRY9390_00341 [Chryseobacterium aquaeductus]